MGLPVIVPHAFDFPMLYRVQAAQDEGFNFRFTSVSFSGDEGWIVGEC